MAERPELKAWHVFAGELAGDHDDGFDRAYQQVTVATYGEDPAEARDNEQVASVIDGLELVKTFDHVPSDEELHELVPETYQ